MKTNETGTMYRAKMSAFWHDIPNCSDILYQRLCILQESGAFLSRIQLGGNAMFAPPRVAVPK
jgi:hypothetical protein